MDGLLYAGLLLLLQPTVITGYKHFNCTSINAPHIGCDVFHGSGNDCRPDILKTDFSNLYSDGLEYPEKPYDFNVNISYLYYSGHSNASYPAFNISIRPPMTSSYKDVRGFEITYMELIAGNTDVKCIIFNLTGQITKDDKENQVTFRAESVGPVPNRADFLLMAYSLPKPAAHYDKDMSVGVSVHTGPPFNTTYPSADSWTTSITYRNFSQQIYFSFRSPPLRFNFQYFIVNLHRVPDDIETTGPVVERKNISEYSGVFTDLSPGWYRLKVYPDDLYFQDMKKCLCKDSYNDCSTCTRTITGAMYIHEPPSSTPSPRTPTTQEPSALRLEDTTGKVVGSVVGSFLGIILIAIIAFFCFMYRRKQGKKQDPEPGKYLPGQEKGQINTNYVNDEKTATTGNQGLGLLKRQKVFLVNTEDHPKHLGVLKSFTTFLEKECLCDVTFAPDSKIGDKSQWIARSMDLANFILVVHSSAAYLQYKSWKENKGELCYQPLTKAGDIFVPALQQITERLSRGKDVEKLISLQFPYTTDRFVIKNLFRGTVFNIPTHLDEFLCHIHGLKPSQGRLEELKLPVRVSIRLRPSGMNLIDAINEAKEYESMHKIRLSSSSEEFDSGLCVDEPGQMEFLYNGADCNSNELIAHTYDNTNNPNRHYDYAFQEGTAPNQLSPEPQTTQSYEYVDMQINTPQRKLFPKKFEQKEMWCAPDSLSEDISAYLEFDGDNSLYQPHPPSYLGEEDVQSKQLRDEIYDINQRYMTKHGLQLLESSPEVEECQSLGGMSV
ncbi:uncharacterized protein LOC117331291 isoform X2 [Pecten maximus]|uniref:uncharacterized protein LOC117331291 isoform X2 n=1 Tax=Pecten maximus TaxID=6579 RepID=UPI00145829F9|nr:uncharacterized protein LOC117331291 isoform X2 [Pecten maximus]